MPIMPADSTTPTDYKVLYIRHKRSAGYADFHEAIEDGWSATMALHARVHIIDTDFDLAQACDQIQPDFIMVEDPGGNRCNTVSITNASAHLHIPRIGLQLQDPHSSNRPSFWKVLDELKAEHYLTWGPVSLRQSPDVASRAYTCPMHCNDKIYHDYKLEKIIPVTVMGTNLLPSFYNWRAETIPLLMQHFPTLLYPHPGYEKPLPRKSFPIQGQAYAEMLNRSHFSIVDPTRSDFVIWKHLEIPGSGSILVSKNISDLAHYGFRDMHNCILGAGDELIEKITSVINDDALYQSIKTNGYSLIHNNYTRQHWRTPINWYECYKNLKPGQFAQQQGVYGPFAAVDAGVGEPLIKLTSLGESEFSKAMGEAFDLIAHDGDLEKAKNILSDIINWFSNLQEPNFLLGVIALLQGNPSQAALRFHESYGVRASAFPSSLYDPEEVAMLKLAAYLMDKAECLADVPAECIDDRHVTLRRVDALIQSLQQNKLALNDAAHAHSRRPGDKTSIHWLNGLDRMMWRLLMIRIVKANRPDLITLLSV